MVQSMSDLDTRCPWCSAPLADAAAERCPSCGAMLVSVGGTEPQLPGVTQLDAEAIIRARSEVARPRSRLFSFLTGSEVPETGGPASAESLAPPPDDVRREMLRLQLEAERADADAERVALKSDVLAEQGIHVNDLGGPPEGEPREDAGEKPAG